MLRSRRGRDAMMFLLFVFISAILWSVLSLSEEEQYDVRLPLKITHIPDSVTLISPGPEALSVSLNAKGSQLLKMVLGRKPDVNVDFRAFRRKKTLYLSSADLKGLVRNATGGSLVSVVYPDSLSLPFTTNPGYKLPISADYRVTVSPQSSLVGSACLSVDSVKIYTALSDLPEGYSEVKTEPIRLSDIDKTTIRRVRLLGPPDSRLIPDSIDVTFVVEPLIFKNRRIVIEAVNVPDSIKLITFPSQIDVVYMVPASSNAAGDNSLRIVVDYNTIEPGSRNVKLQVRDVSEQMRNVHLSADSAEYIIEHH